MDLRLLGPVQLWVDQRQVALGPPKQRLVLAVLALEINKPVPVDRIVDLTWPCSPPATAHHAVQVRVCCLRSVLAGANGGRRDLELVTEGQGYRLVGDPAYVDAHRFRALVDRARADIRDSERVALLRRAQELWRGPPLFDVAEPGVADQLCGGLNESRILAMEVCLDAELRLGHHQMVIEELTDLVAMHPYRERLIGQLMLALYRDGCPRDALDTYRQARRRFVDELGLEPDPHLRELEGAILRADPVLDARQNGTELRPQLPVPRQLPADISTFTGRANQLSELSGLLPNGDTSSSTAIVVITGTAGVGKTALAIHWARQVSDRFTGGQLHVNLRGFANGSAVRPVEALARFLHALGVDPARVPVDLDEAAGMYRSMLAGTRTLLVLDNAASEDQVRPLLPGVPGCLVLVTSRNRLGGLIAKDGARRLDLDLLTPAEAVTLLRTILGPDRTAAEPEATAELALLCAYLPLALRIAAANLANHPRHSLTSYAADLRAGNRVAALRVDDDEDAAVEAAFDCSYSALPDDVRRLFRLACLGPGPDITAHDAAASLQSSVHQARRLLEQLAAAHLVTECAPGRYSMHDLLRIYGSQRTLAEDSPGERSAALARLFAAYLGAADRAARELYPHVQRLPVPEIEPVDLCSPALEWLEAERTNLVAAILHASKDGHRQAAWLLADTLRGYFWLRRHGTDWLATARAALSATETVADPSVRSAALLNFADAQASLGDYGSAMGCYHAAIGHARHANGHGALAAALLPLGMLHLEHGNLGESESLLTEAALRNRELGCRLGEGIALVNLGELRCELGQLAQAVADLRTALAHFVDAGHLSGQAGALVYLGYAHQIKGRLAAASDRMTRGLALFRAAGHRAGEAAALYHLAVVDLDIGRRSIAREHAQAALALTREIHECNGEPAALNSLGTIDVRLGQYDDAIANHAEALRMASKTGNRRAEARASMGLGCALRSLEEMREADRFADEAVALTRDARLRQLEGQALTVHADVDLASGRPDRAVRRAHDALAIHRDVGSRLGIARTLAVLGNAHREMDRVDAARPCWRKAHDLLRIAGAIPEAEQLGAMLAD